MSQLRRSTLVALALLVSVTLPTPAPSQAGSNQGTQGEDPLGGHPLDYWIKRVKTRDRFQTEEALKVLQKAGAKARPATSVVLRAMKRKDVAVLAIQTLSALGPIPKKAVPKLVECLKKRTTCAAAMSALATMGRDAKGAERMLTRLIHAPDYRAGAYATLEAIGSDTVKLLGEDLQSNRWRRDALERVFAKGHKAEETLPDVIKVLQFYPRFVTDVGGIKTKAAMRALEKAKAEFRVRAKAAAGDRALAARIIGKLGTPERALPAIKKGLLDFDAEAAKASAWALMIHGAKAAVPTLTKAIDRKNPKNFQFLVAGLRGFGPGAKGAILTLKKISRKNSKHAKLAGEAAVAIERSMTHLERSQSQDAKVARASTLQLLEYGPEGLPGVITALATGDEKLQMAVLRKVVAKPGRYLAVGSRAVVDYPKLPPPRMDPVAFVPLLMEHARGQNQGLARDCCRALGLIGAPTAEHAVPVLKELLIEADDAGKKKAGVEVRIAACHALLSFGVASELDDAVFAGFVPNLDTRNKRVVQAIVGLFGELDTRAESTLPKLIAMFDQGGDAAQNAAASIHAVGATAVPRLIAGLRDASINRRAWSAYTLGLLGKSAAAAANALERVIADDPSDIVKKAAREALGRVR